ncbi:MAG: hypothetical protein LJE64_07070 [Desulfofustis sp.]|jgi:hypothetical protein|nr:hypothetical protein [Desulfofustis sp.]
MMDERSYLQPESGRKLGLGGIKFSDAQSRLVFRPVGGLAALSRILAAFAGKRINLHQLVFRKIPVGGVELYLARNAYLQNRSLIDGELDSHGLAPAEVAEPVGTLTLFPHASSMEVLLKVIGIAVGSGLPVHSMCSSLSALCIATDAERLDELAGALLEVFSLPDGHSPFRYEQSDLDRRLTGGQGRIVETIARYWEPVIRIYGSSLKTGLTGVSVSADGDRLLEVIGELADCRIARFLMVELTGTESGRYSLQLIFDPEHQHGAAAALSFGLERIDNIEYYVWKGLELLFFHGPHFQDRYGVMHTAVAALSEASVEISSAICSGTGVHLVAKEEAGRHMLDVLGEVFVVP